MRYRLDPELVVSAGLTVRETEALELKLGAGFGTRQIALALGISRTAARDRLDSALRKVERVMQLPESEPDRVIHDPEIRPMEPA